MGELGSNYGTYCSITTFRKAVDTISEDISVVDLPPIPKYDESNPGATISCLVNTVWTLLQHRQNLLVSKQTLEEKTCHLSQDVITLKNKYERLNTNILQCKDELNRQKELTTLKERDKNQALLMLKTQKLKVQELEHLIKNKEQQFMHEFKKQQCEIAALQSQLRSIFVKEKGIIWKKPMCNSKKLISHDHNNITGQTTEKEEHERLCQKTFNQMEINLQTLVEENVNLKRLLENVGEELAKLMEQHKKVMLHK